ncbi:MAG: GDYXXLXY domain-containing protein [Hyphomicrobiaceae bacterium]
MAVEFGKRAVGGRDSAAVATSGSGSGVGGGSVTSASAMSFQDRLRVAAQIAAAALIGFGVMLWVAAHWDEISRFARFAIVGGALAVAVLVSLINAARTPGLVVSFLATGGLLALIGQTYQTGADPWQLFALWAAIGVPWALAARSDALWLVWTVVAMLAITLWLATFVGSSGWPRERNVILAAWLMAIAIAALLSPFVRLTRWLGETCWSFRLAALLTIVLITQSGAMDLISARDVPTLYWLALLVLGGMAALLFTSPILDIVLISALGLSLDTLLIIGFGKIVLQAANADFGSFLIVGLAGAALVAGTGAFILKLMRERVGGGLDLDVLKGREWPVILMTGIGALLTTLPLGASLSLFFGPFINTGIGPYLIGAGFLAASVVVIRSHVQTSFLHQLAAIGLTLGFCLIAYGLFRDSDGAIAPACAALAVLAVGVAVLVGQSWTAALLGAAAGVSAAIVFNQLLTPAVHGSDLPRITASIGFSIVLALGAAWLVWSSTMARSTSPSIIPSGFAQNHAGVAAGAITAGLLGAMATAGPTFLLSGAIGIEGFGSHRHLVTGIPLSWASLSPLSALLAAAGCALLLVPRPQFRTALGIGAALVAIVLSAVIPSLGAPVLLLCAAVSSGHRALGIGAFVAALWVLGSFYYWLGWPLAEKAALMFAAGVVLAALCIATGLRRPAIGFGSDLTIPPLVARSLVLAGALAVGGLAVHSITSNEAIIASGRQVFLALAPVDPRSLMQGDYMRLNFAVPAEARQSNAAHETSNRSWAIATVDDRQVATVANIVDEQPRPLRTEQIALPMRRKQGRWIVGTDAWFFKEGTATKWEIARFGIFRVGANGTALLVGMADKDLVPIK